MDGVLLADPTLQQDDVLDIPDSGQEGPAPHQEAAISAATSIAIYGRY